VAELNCTEVEVILSDLVDAAQRGGVYLLAFVIYAGVFAAATHTRIRSFKAISAGMLSPLGVVFGLFVVFTAAQVWSDSDRASTAISREATALRSVLVLAASFPGEPENKLRSLVREYVQQAATVEWPLMAHRAASLNAPSPDSSRRCNSSSR